MQSIITHPAVDRVRLCNCGTCWASPGKPCTITGPAGDHLARWQRAERRGVITREELAAVAAGLEVAAGHKIVREGSQRAARNAREVLKACGLDADGVLALRRAAEDGAS